MATDNGPVPAGGRDLSEATPEAAGALTLTGEHTAIMATSDERSWSTDGSDLTPQFEDEFP